MPELASPIEEHHHIEAEINTSIKEPSKRALFDYEQDFTYKGMAETPVDTITKIPLPILPRKTEMIYDNGLTNNWHHHYHPKNHHDLKSDNGLALRTARVQLVPVSDHTRYHQIFEGPPLPRSNAERFGQVVLVCAGYIPRQAIDVYSDDPSHPINLDSERRERIMRSGEVRNTGEYFISKLIRNHLVGQDFSEVNDRLIDEFINTQSIRRKRYLGHYLLAIASERAVEPIWPIFHQALDEGLVQKPKKKLSNLVKSKINGKKTAEQTITDLHRRLVLVNS